MTESSLEEIKTYKKQLDELIDKKFTDPSLILGLNNVIQSKFEQWILKDSNEYYSKVEEPHVDANYEVEFNTVKILDTLWTNFHYPIIKFFQYEHANYFNGMLNHFNSMEAKQNFKPKPVEIRKINDYFLKFAKNAHGFYMILLKHYSTHFNIPLLPRKFLIHFDFKVPNSAIKTSNQNLQANLLFIIHKCLLALGNVSRHRSFVELSYVLPCLSSRNFHKFRLLNEARKEHIMKPYYEKAIDFYECSITLLPALNEPYNHIGMIYNLMDNKVDACYWFLRSQFTRIPSYKLGLTNLNNLIKKKWFLNHLSSILVKSSPSKFSKETELNIILICIIGHFYLPEVYKLGKNNLLPKLTFNKAEFIFLNLNFNAGHFQELISKNEPLNFYVKQLILLITFYGLKKSKNLAAFIMKFIKTFLHGVLSTDYDEVSRKNVFIFLRLTLSWIKEDKSILKEFQFNSGLIKNLVQLCNRYLEEYGASDVESETSTSQDYHYVEIRDLLASNSRPLRNYYFLEDVLLKDFLLIKYQFKDFKDDHLFESSDIDLLNNDYSSLVVNNFPSFLNNETFLKFDKLDDNFLIETEVLKYENFQRLKSILVLGKKLLNINNKVVKVEFDNTFKFSETTVKASESSAQKKKERSKRKKEEAQRKSQTKGKPTSLVNPPKTSEPAFNKSPSDETQKVQVEYTHSEIDLNENDDAEDNVDSSDDFSDDNSNNDGSLVLDEIESFIIRHTNQLSDQINADNNDFDTDISHKTITEATHSSIWKGSQNQSNPDSNKSNNSKDVSNLPEINSVNQASSDGQPFYQPHRGNTAVDKQPVQQPHYTQAFPAPQVPQTPIPMGFNPHPVTMNPETPDFNPFHFQAGSTPFNYPMYPQQMYLQYGQGPIPQSPYTPIQGQQFPHSPYPQPTYPPHFQGFDPVLRPGFDKTHPLVANTQPTSNQKFTQYPGESNGHYNGQTIAPSLQSDINASYNSNPYPQYQM